MTYSRNARRRAIQADRKAGRPIPSGRAARARQVAVKAIARIKHGEVIAARDRAKVEEALANIAERKAQRRKEFGRG